MFIFFFNISKYSFFTILCVQQWRKGSHVGNKQPSGSGPPHTCTQWCFTAFRWRCLTWGQFHWLSIGHQWLLSQVRCQPLNRINTYKFYPKQDIINTYTHTWLLFSVDTTFPHFTITTILHKRPSTTKHNHAAAGPHHLHCTKTWLHQYVRLFVVWIR